MGSRWPSGGRSTTWNKNPWAGVSGLEVPGLFAGRTLGGDVRQHGPDAEEGGGRRRRTGAADRQSTCSGAAIGARDGFIYFTDAYPGGIVRIPENGGAKEPVTIAGPAEGGVHPPARASPAWWEGDHLHGGVRRHGDRTTMPASSSRSWEPSSGRSWSRAASAPRYSPSGHIVYANAGDLYAVPFDLNRLETTGPPIKVVDGVQMSTNTGAAYFDVSGAGALAYVPGHAEGGTRTLVWVDRQGAEEELPLKRRAPICSRASRPMARRSSWKSKAPPTTCTPMTSPARS